MEARIKNETTHTVVMGDWSSNGVTGPGKAVRVNYRILDGFCFRWKVVT